MSGVDIMGQKPAASRLSNKSKYHFFLRKFFNLIDVTHVDNHIVCMKLGDDISLLNFKIVAANILIGRYRTRKRSFLTSEPSN